MATNVEISDAPTGDKLGLQELQTLAKDDPKLQQLTEEEKDELIQKLQEHRELKKTGTRASNRAAAQDVRLTLQHVNAEVKFSIHNPLTCLAHQTSHIQLDDLADRTGIYAITFVTRGHVDDMTLPGWFATGDSAFFLRDHLKLEPWDIVRLFEQWACSRQKSKSSLSCCT
jgi:hypothetical protein